MKEAPRSLYAPGQFQSVEVNGNCDRDGEWIASHESNNSNAGNAGNCTRFVVLSVFVPRTVWPLVTMNNERAV